jgi:glutathione S-transferase
LLRDAWALGGQFEKHLGCIDVAFHRHIEKHRTFAQQRGTVTNAPPRMVAYSVAALIGQLAHRRLITGDGVTAADVAVSFSLNGLRPRQS